MEVSMSVRVDYSKSGVTSDILKGYQNEVSKLHSVIHEKTGAGNDFLGWLEYPKNYDVEEFNRVKTAAKKIQSNSDVLVVVGIGGSY
jgi:glucose-6-phosphate isomerase